MSFEQGKNVICRYCDFIVPRGTLCANCYKYLTVEGDYRLRLGMIKGQLVLSREERLKTNQERFVQEQQERKMRRESREKVRLLIKKYKI